MHRGETSSSFRARAAPRERRFPFDPRAFAAPRFEPFPEATVGEVLLARAGTARFVDKPHLIFVASNGDRKSTRLNSSHMSISYAVFCLKKKKKQKSKSTNTERRR